MAIDIWVVKLRSFNIIKCLFVICGWSDEYHVALYQCWFCGLYSKNVKIRGKFSENLTNLLREISRFQRKLIKIKYFVIENDSPFVFSNFSMIHSNFDWINPINIHSITAKKFTLLHSVNAIQRHYQSIKMFARAKSRRYE